MYKEKFTTTPAQDQIILTVFESVNKMKNNICFCALVLTNEYEDKYEPSKPTASNPEESEVITVITPTRKGKHDKHDKKKKKNDKGAKKADRRGKPGKEGKIGGKKNGKKASKWTIQSPLKSQRHHQRVPLPPFWITLKTGGGCW